MTNAKQARAMTGGLASIHTHTPTTHISALGAGTAFGTGSVLTMNQINAIKASHSVNLNSGLHHNLSSTLTTVNLNNLSGLTIPGLQLLDTHHAVKKYEVYESPEDILVLSVAASRLYKTNGYYKLLDKELFDKIIPEDRDHAQSIRDYYSKKIMIWKLKDSSKMSSYREDLNTFVHSNGLTFREEMIGLAYHLPAFYKYDLDLDYVRSCVDIQQGFKKLDDEDKPRILKCTVDMEPIKKIVKKRKRLEVIQYWFKDTQLNAGCVVTIDKDNPLEHIWEHLFNTEKVLQIEGNFVRLKLDDFEYFRVRNWKLVQI